MFEQGPIALVKLFQRIGPIPLTAREKDQIMRPRDGVDAVQLDETKTRD